MSSYLIVVIVAVLVGEFLIYRSWIKNNWRKVAKALDVFVDELIS